MDTLKQSKRFIFTLHKEENMNYDDFVNLFNELEIGEYGGCQMEQCPETNRYHIQGWCVFKSNMRLKALKDINARIHWENMRGSIEQSIEYCSKEESRVIPYRSWGVPPQPRPGKRSDLDDAVNYIRSLMAVQPIVCVCLRVNILVYMLNISKDFGIYVVNLKFNSLYLPCLGIVGNKLYLLHVC